MAELREHRHLWLTYTERAVLAQISDPQLVDSARGLTHTCGQARDGMDSRFRVHIMGVEVCRSVTER